MGGRGSTSGMSGGGSNSVIDSKAKTRTIETEYKKGSGFGGGYYKSEVLEAVENGKGNLKFLYATPEKREQTAKTNKTQYLTYKLKAGAENGETFGINWDNVKSVSGQTYNLRSEVKDRGFKWDGKTKSWIR